MAKERTSVCITGDLLEKAQAQGVNVSATLEKALYAKFHGRIDDDVLEKRCGMCNKTREETHDKAPMIWFYITKDYGHWICTLCLSSETKIVKVGCAHRA